MNNFGIDFGTTNSGAFELNSRVRYGDDAGRPLPSIVVIDKATGRALSGREAWRDRLALAEEGNYEVLPPIKTLLGTGEERSIGGKRWTVADLASVVLDQLVERAAADGGISEAVFSIPVGLSPKARRDLRQAAGLSGIEVKGFIKESTAALIRYWGDLKNCRAMVVFDWGGGTLDISVLKLQGRQIHELQTCGSPDAGDRIDDDLMRLVHQSIMRRRESSRSLEELPQSERDELRFQCELAKCILAGAPESGISMKSYDGNPERIMLSRRDCEPVIGPRVRTALDLLDTAIKKAGLSIDAIDEIIVIGGCSQLWLFREMLRDDPRFRGRYKLAENPDWDVAHGAALVQKNPGCFVLAESLRLQLSDGTCFPLARPGDQSPGAMQSVSLALVEDAEAANVIIERQGEGQLATETALQFSVPTQGFDLEEIRLDYVLTPDLTFQISGQSMAKNGKGPQKRETDELRFRYSMDRAS